MDGRRREVSGHARQTTALTGSARLVDETRLPRQARRVNGPEDGSTGRAKLQPGLDLGDRLVEQRQAVARLIVGDVQRRDDVGPVAGDERAAAHA